MRLTERDLQLESGRQADGAHYALEAAAGDRRANRERCRRRVAPLEIGAPSAPTAGLRRSLRRRWRRCRDGGPSRRVTKAKCRRRSPTAGRSSEAPPEQIRSTDARTTSRDQEVAGTRRVSRRLGPPSRHRRHRRRSDLRRPAVGALGAPISSGARRHRHLSRFARRSLLRLPGRSERRRPAGPNSSCRSRFVSRTRRWLLATIHGRRTPLLTGLVEGLRPRARRHPRPHRLDAVHAAALGRHPTSRCVHPSPSRRGCSATGLPSSRASPPPPATCRRSPRSTPGATGGSVTPRSRPGATLDLDVPTQRLGGVALGATGRVRQAPGRRLLRGLRGGGGKAGRLLRREGPSPHQHADHLRRALPRAPRGLLGARLPRHAGLHRRLQPQARLRQLRALPAAPDEADYVADQRLAVEMLLQAWRRAGDNACLAATRTWYTSRRRCSPASSTSSSLDSSPELVASIVDAAAAADQQARQAHRASATAPDSIPAAGNATCRQR